MYAVAEARANIALVKYWGKASSLSSGSSDDPSDEPSRPPADPSALSPRDERGLATENLPAMGSLSLTLSSLCTKTSVMFDTGLGADELYIDGQRKEGPALARVGRVLAWVRKLSHLDCFAQVRSKSNFPTASGLASSASGMAALALASAAAAGLASDINPSSMEQGPSLELQDLARLGSGSAVRSLLGGFVEMGVDGHAKVLRSESNFDPPFDVAMVVAIADAGEKAISSREGMRLTAAHSAYYPEWLASHPADLAAAKRALAAGNLDRLGEVMEDNCLKMHAAAMAAGIIYFKPPTLLAIEEVRALRARGLSAYFTVDAGPHVKVLCPQTEAATIQLALARVPGFAEVRIAEPGAGARVIPDAELAALSQTEGGMGMGRPPIDAPWLEDRR